MEFRDSYRMEAIYFQTLKEEINRVKALMASGNTEQAKALLENAVNVDGAVLLLYRNLGELWGGLGAKIEEVKKELEKLDSRVDDYHRELNEKIDDVNNTIIRLINALEERVEALEDCCEEVQEALENKQDKLIASDGIEINEDNEIRCDLFDLSNSTSLNTALRPFVTRSIERSALGAGPFATYITYLIEKLKLSATGAEFKNALSGYKNVAISFSTGLSAPTLTPLLTNGDFYEFERTYFRVPDDLITIFQRCDTKVGTPKLSDNITASISITTRFLISGLERLLSKMNDDDTYTFEWSFRYWTYVNGNRIIDTNGAYAGLIDPANFTLGNVAFFGLK